jgi:hypothetical protein
MKNMLITMAILLATSTGLIAQDDVQVPKEALQEMAFLVGEWEVEGTFEGEKISGTYSAQWAAGKHCLQLTTQWEGALNSHAAGIGGWAADKKQYVEYWYDTDGNSQSYRYSLNKKKSAWSGRWTETDSEGKKASGKITLNKKENVFVCTATGTLGDGTKTEFKATFKKK